MKGKSKEEDSLLERITAAAEERQLSHNSLIAYRRTWLKIIWAAAEGLGLETFPVEKGKGVLEQATRGPKWRVLQPGGPLGLIKPSLSFFLRHVAEFVGDKSSWTRAAALRIMPSRSSPCFSRPLMSSCIVLFSPGRCMSSSWKASRDTATVSSGVVARIVALRGWLE